MNRRIAYRESRRRIEEALRAMRDDHSPRGQRLWVAMVNVLSTRNLLDVGREEEARAKLGQARALLGELREELGVEETVEELFDLEPVKVVSRG